MAALVVGRVLGDVDRRTAVLAAEREALEQSERHEQDRREDADRRVVGSRPIGAVEPPMIEQRDHERVFAADEVADAPEHDRAERTDGEAGGERRERRAGAVARCRREERAEETARTPKM